jgi:hypothetical protein
LPSCRPSLAVPKGPASRARQSHAKRVTGLPRHEDSRATRALRHSRDRDQVGSAGPTRSAGILPAYTVRISKLTYPNGTGSWRKPLSDTCLHR